MNSSEIPPPMAGVSHPKEVNPATSEEIAVIPDDLLGVEVGLKLIPLVNLEEGAKLPQRGKDIRKQIAREIGIVLPRIHFKDNLSQDSNGYKICIRGIKVASGKIMMNQFLAFGPERVLKSLSGTQVLDPAYGLPGVWISPKQREQATDLGCMVFDPVSVITAHITETVRVHAAELLGLQDTKKLVEVLRKTEPSLVEIAVPDNDSLFLLRKVLQNFLKERVSIRNLDLILEAFHEAALISPNPHLITENIRMALRDQVCRDYVSKDGTIPAFTLGDRMIALLEKSFQDNLLGPRIILSPDHARLFHAQLQGVVKLCVDKGLASILISPRMFRKALKEMTHSTFPNLVVLADREIPLNVTLDILGELEIPD